MTLKKLFDTNQLLTAAFQSEKYQWFDPKIKDLERWRLLILWAVIQHLHYNAGTIIEILRLVTLREQAKKPQTNKQKNPSKKPPSVMQDLVRALQGKIVKLCDVQGERNLVQGHCRKRPSRKSLKDWFGQYWSA